LGKKDAPELLSMAPCYMEGLNSNYYVNTLGKAKAANVWVVKRENATMAPNYFVSYDLKTFTQLTNLVPQRRYNWLTAELHSFKQLDGTISQGVLYKPENFDPAKKYPLIISFYSNLSDRLHKYPAANYMNRPSIFDEPAWMVSHGYLIFIPDIYFIKDQWGPSTVNTIDGAARYLRQLPYVDGAHMGAVGHSNSGRFGYYLLTHSKSFAAMSIGAGAANIINVALSLEKDQKSRLSWGEIESYPTGLGHLWQNKNAWLDHTSVLHADKVESPLLLFHCKKDGAPVEQAVQMFAALRRLEKKCWWLQYDNGDHIVGNDDARDWTIRYTQFFDHYLKGAPPPLWMTRGIPAAMKGIEAGYELDPQGNCDMESKNSCKICHNLNKQYRPTFFSKSNNDMHIKKR
jgi:dipeptidyl aminopeptidase/acylaminoacyl peptidase